MHVCGKACGDACPLPAGVLLDACERFDFVPCRPVRLTLILNAKGASLYRSALLSPMAAGSSKCRSDPC